MARVWWLLALLVCVSGARELTFRQCKKTEPGTMKNCKIKSVEVEGCSEPTTWVDEDGAVVEYTKAGDPKSPCRIGVGSELNFTINYEPGFAADSLRAQFTIPMLEACWEDNGSQCPLSRSPFIACQQTKCPLNPGQQHIYETTLKISDTVNKRPVNSLKVYQMKWKLWDHRNKRKNCCVNFPVQY